jgi:hypothetical protein
MLKRIIRSTIQHEGTNTVSTTENTAMTDEQVLAQLKESREKLERVRDQRIRLQAEEERDRKALAELQAKMQAQYGVASPKELWERLEGMRKTNRTKVSEFVVAVDAAREKVEATTKALAELDAGKAA